MDSQSRPRLRPSQETIATLGTGASIVALVVTVGMLAMASISEMREEAQAEREAWQAEARQLRDEARADREAWQAEARQLRDEARAEREAWRAEARASRERVRREILRLTGEVATPAEAPAGQQ